MSGSLLIIGVGFMGGSLALALRRKGYRGPIYGIDVVPQVIDEAVEMGVLDEGSVSMEDVRRFAPETVVLASPVGTFRNIAKELRDLLPDGTLITDLGSVKGKLVHDLEKILGETYVGSHPIAGTEKSGVKHSLPELFEGKKIIVTPTSRTDREALARVVSLWERTGGIVEFMDPLLHDWVFGAVSHLPHAVAFALMEAITEMSDGVDLFKYPGAGFRDFTRIAGSDPVMWRDIFLENRENVLRALDVYTDSLKKLRDLIEAEEGEKLTEYLREAKRRRMSIE
ncbi:MAG TPA: prephenate dehydrogenase/arogenate dehydrogenase family protein [Aquifex aeolicus]|uniref:prephenate dehydrogenase n=1 Tax=Aquifex aeolicus TaxID=63363 RepID=A0A7C5LA87_AQUAO|nr:prephenate dehydrogenase/arogenate dehydrogenase family protein [Aquifex aeolicus]